MTAPRVPDLPAPHCRCGKDHGLHSHGPGCRWCDCPYYVSVTGSLETVDPRHLARAS